ncbi:MAG: glycine zipper 2TM domain-containing protein [Sulfuricurvum sp.]|nr:glycine zipper 2TM domain-containing protein [Sulfuricurvum sp.]MDD5386465.1 glycine zipper 2TM domain-containing protein [Sulfuricurvum sp.]
MKKNTLILAMTLVTTALSAESFTMTEYVKVNSSIPAYSTINEDVPTEQCYDVREAISNGGTGNADVVGAVAGGALGGVLGHQVGGGKGKTAATIGGAVLGVLAGQNVGSKYNTPQNTSYQVVRKCETVYTTKSRQVIDGYTNVAKFKGKEIRIQSDAPLKQIPVTVTYSY